MDHLRYFAVAQTTPDMLENFLFSFGKNLGEEQGFALHARPHFLHRGRKENIAREHGLDRGEQCLRVVVFVDEPRYV